MTATHTPARLATPWHRLSTDEALRQLGSGPGGLTATEAAARLAAHGRNELVDHGSKPPLKILWEQLTAVMVVILIGAAALSLALGKLLEAGAILAIVVLFALLGFVQEYRAERAIAALRKMAVPIVRVTRDGQLVEVPAAELVPGDVVALEAGTVVPADLRLVEVANLRVQEAMLTGESEPIDKQTAALDRDDLALGDRTCLAYSGTQVTYGRGVGLVVETGMGTELGRIASMIQTVAAERTPLQHRLDQVGKQLALVGLVVALLVVVMGAMAGESASDLVLTAISVAVAVIPEGLPAVVTFTLAIGAQRMLRRNALIRKLPAVETLGSVTTICSDKTGTLTQNRMTVSVVDVADHRVALRDESGDVHESAHRSVAAGPDALRVALVAGLLCNDADARIDDGRLAMIGDPTETALVQAAHDGGLDVVAARAAAPRIGEQPFDSDRKRMSTLHAPLDGRVPWLHALPQDVPIAFVKGAVDGLLAHTAAVWSASGPVPIDAAALDRVHAANDALAADGMRVLGVAYRTVPEAVDDLETGLVLVGLVGIIDPPRSEARDAVTVCRTAGIRPVMITGDHPLTARAIAKELGIAVDDRVLTGAELDRLDGPEFAEAAREVSVFARVSPEHKLRIVESLQSEGQIVAMTGDGVNDAPALKRSDIGVAMGITGTDVSKESSDMVLRDDNFATIVAAVEEGRVIYDNLRRFVSFAIAGNLGKIIVMLGWPIPFLLSGGDVDTAVALLPLQLLWLNLMTDGLLGLSMGVEPAERGVMRRPPHAPGASLWAGGLGRQTALIGLYVGIVSLGTGFAYYALDDPAWQAMMFTTIAFLQVFQALGTRSRTESLRTIGFTTNRLMLAIVAIVVALQLAALYTPLRDFLDLEQPDGIDVAISFALGLSLLVVLEAAKAIGRRRARGGETTGERL
ncbi:MAG: cation-translocating P-type ATPase [Ilumatobacteraceae bacterium]|jgi:Ca2+-transporting ATPase|nr:cation-translocating P-type ATPase [Ilumatobacteraceae bacterium]